MTNPKELAAWMMRTAATRAGDPEMADRILVGAAEAKGNGAVISDCRTYRYVLWRSLSGAGLAGSVLWVMVNPSTADAWTDDATIRKVMGFSRRWGFAQARVVNLYALRSRNPKALLTHPEPVGPENDRYICLEASVADGIVLAWGNNADPARARDVRGLIRMNTEAGGEHPTRRERSTPIWHLGLTGPGQPKHPLMLGYDTIRKEID